MGVQSVGGSHINPSPSGWGLCGVQVGVKNGGRLNGALILLTLGPLQAVSQPKAKSIRCRFL